MERVSPNSVLRRTRLRLARHLREILGWLVGLVQRRNYQKIYNGNYSLVTVPVVSGHTVLESSPPNDALRLFAFAIDVPFEPVARGLLYASLLVLVGVPLALAVIVWPVLGENSRLTQRSRYLLTGASLVLLLSVALLAAVRVSRLEQSMTWFAALMNTPLGRTALVQLVVAGLLVGVGLAALRQPWETLRRTWLGAIFAGGVLIALTVSLTSHSASSDGVVGLLVDFSHLVGASVWVGGLAALALLVPPELDTHETEAARHVTVRLIRRFSVVAIAAVGLAVTSGLLLVGWHVPGFGALTSTRYGSVLSVKVVFVLIVIGLGGLNRFVIQRSLRENTLWSWSPDRETVIRWFVRSVRVELTVFLLVLALTGTLTSLPTATVAEQTATDNGRGQMMLIGESESTEIRLKVAPVHVGQNTIELSFVHDKSLVETDRTVSIMLTHPESDIKLPPETLTVSENGHYSGTVVFPTHGQWNVHVRTRIDDQSVSEQFSVRIPADDTNKDSETETSDRTTDNRFSGLMRTGALLVGIATLLAVGYDLFTLRFNGPHG
jgi:copper transport protein